MISSWSCTPSPVVTVIKKFLMRFLLNYDKSVEPTTWWKEGKDEEKEEEEETAEEEG